MISNTFTIQKGITMHYYMFYKPYGCVSARTDQRYPTVMDYFKELDNPMLSPVGRLDRETEGLLLITDDGKWNQQLIHPKFHLEKTYEFLALGTLDQTQINALQRGVLLTGAASPTAPTRVSVQNNVFLKDVLPSLHPEIRERLSHNRPEQPVVMGQLTITEGKKRQVRRMLKAVGCYVIYLKRLSIGNIVLDDSLHPGEWIPIDPATYDTAHDL